MDEDGLDPSHEELIWSNDIPLWYKYSEEEEEEEEEE